MLRAGDDYLAALRDGRRVYVGGELVSDVTAHPSFRHTAHSFAALYDKKRASDLTNSMSFESDDGPCSIWFMQPKTKSDLRARLRGHYTIAHWSYGLLGRSPDHVASFIAGLAMQPELLDANRSGFGTNLVSFFERLKNEDLFASYCVIGPQGARSPAVYSRASHHGPALRVVRETDRGIILNGVKMLGTAAVFSDVAWIGNLLPLAGDQASQAVTCAVPINAKGLSIWVRSPTLPDSALADDRPFSTHFDESDAVMLFENVEVPWSDVFLLDDASLSREMYFETPSHVMGNHQATIRFLEKLRFLLGIAYTAAESNDVLHVPTVRDSLARLAAAEAGLRSMISGAIEDAEAVGERFIQPNRRAVYAALHWCTVNYHLIAEQVRELLGAGPFQMPADSSFMDEPAMLERFDTYWIGPSGSAMERFRFLKTAWDYLGSELAARHGQYERFYAGPQFMHAHYNFAACPWGEHKRYVAEVTETVAVPRKEKPALVMAQR